MSTINIEGDGDILLVDDDEQFHMLIKFVFKRHKHIANNLVTLASGEKCLEWLSANCEEKQALPALILMDINMPGFSGIETVQMIRSKPQFAEAPRISMLSSSNFSGDIEKSLSAGANEYIEKPFDLRELTLVKASPDSD